MNICNRRICNSKQSHLLAWACRLWSPGAGTPDKESNEKWEHSKGFQRVSKVSKKPKRKARIDLKESGFLPDLWGCIWYRWYSHLKTDPKWCQHASFLEVPHLTSQEILRAEATFARLLSWDQSSCLVRHFGTSILWFLKSRVNGSNYSEVLLEAMSAGKMFKSPQIQPFIVGTWIQLSKSQANDYSI